jgi:hypothetical protein
MRNLYIILFALLLLAFVFWSARRTEGFQTVPHVRQGNYVLDLLGHLKRTSRKLADPTLWNERMALLGKSPVELARAYIKSQTKQE